MAGSPDRIANILLGLLRDLRLAKGQSLELIAEQAGIHRTHLGLLEKLERQPTLPVASKIAESLGYPLSELLLKAELIEAGKLSREQALAATTSRTARKECLRNTDALTSITGLSGTMIVAAINSAYSTLDVIDSELVANGGIPISNLVELANLSSMVGNLLGAGLAESSEGLYVRNRPHAFPDLLEGPKGKKQLEIKMALEKNRPKGHLAKSGNYVTFRYSLGASDGIYTRGKEQRGQVVWVWEAKVGKLLENDFDISNTEGDSGKTAVIKTTVFNAMKVVYFDPNVCPYPMRKGTYPGLN
jgi:transcriptional regulator with XRE-family HTH domain